MKANICGADLYWETFGKGVPLVCIHGSGVDHRSIKSAMEPVCGGLDGFQRIYLDLPGMGQSQTHTGIITSDDMLEMVCQFIDHVLGPDQQFALVGYSYGGYLARGVLYQMDRRVRGLALICPVVSFRRSSRKLPEFRCCARDENFLRSLTPSQISQMDGFVTVQTREVWEAYAANILPSLDLADQRLMIRIRDTEFSFPVDRPAKPWDIPALILAGQYDVSVGYEDALGLADNFSNPEVVVLEASGHLPHMEAPQAFNDRVRAWLKKLACAEKAGG